jgi:predicted permease
MGFSPQQLTSAASFLMVAGRLRDGVSMEQAGAEMSSIGKGLQEAFPDRNKNQTIRVEPIRRAFFAGLDEPLLVLQAAVLFVLLIACANVAGLLLARASARGTEVAVRGALGAGRARLIRQMLTESVILSLAGGVAGVAFGWVGLRALLASLDPGDLPSGLGIDYRVLIFTAGISVLTGLVFGLAPALQTTRVDLVAALKEAGRTGMEAGSKQRIRSIMVGAQISLALILLIGAGLMMTSFLKLSSNPLGMDTSNVLSFEFRFGQNQLMKAVGRYRNVGLWEIFPVAGQTYQRIFERMQTIPGVVSTAAISRAPGSGNWMGMGFQIAGQPARDPNTPGGNNQQAAYFAITPGYFQTMRIPVLQGRDFNDRDTATGPPVILINKAMADRWFPNQNPMGQRITLDFVPDEPVREVIGVVGNTLAGAYQRNPEPTVFIPHLQQTQRWQGPAWDYRAAMVFVLRASGDPNALIPTVRNAVAEIDPSKPASEMRTIDQMLSSNTSGDRVFSILLAIFGGAAALLAAIGIYGVMAYAVAQRTREIGVRMALGASAPNVVSLVVRQVLVLVAVGMAVGLAGAYGLTRFLQNFLWNVSPTDPVIFTAVAAGLFVVSAVACLVPTLRAMRIDPATALRYE